VELRISQDLSAADYDDDSGVSAYCTVGETSCELRIVVVAVVVVEMSIN